MVPKMPGVARVQQLRTAIAESSRGFVMPSPARNRDAATKLPIESDTSIVATQATGGS
jgi:hypothetical protein